MSLLSQLLVTLIGQRTKVREPHVQ